MKKINQLKVGAVLSYITLFLNNVISLIYTPIMLRLLGQSEFGLYNIANSIVGYLGVLDFGLGNAIVRYTSKYKAEEDSESEYNLNGIFLVVYSIIAIIVLVIGIVFIFNAGSLFSKSLSNEELSIMKVLMGIMIFNLAISFPGGIFAAIITAHERFVFPRILGIIRSILNPFIMIPILLIGYKSIGMMVATTVLNIFYIIVNMFYCFKKLNVRISFKNLDFSVLKEITGYSFFIFLNLIVDRIYWSTDQLILGAIRGSTAVAIYTVGSTFNTYYMSFSTAISGVFLPKVTKMVTKNVDNSEISDLFIKIGRLQYIVMSFILSGFILVGYDFIRIWAGKGYDEAYFIALVVMIPLTVPLIQNMGITILQAKNMHKFRSNVYIAIAILNMVASIPLAEVYGGIGAALATSISMTIGNIIIMNIYYYKKVNIDIKSFWNEIAKMSVPVIISLIIGLVLNTIIYSNGIISIFIRGTMFSLIYIVLMWNKGMNNYEKQLIGEPIKNISKKILIKLGIKKYD